MKINLWKDLQKILIGFFAMFCGYNGYFAISGNLPPAHPDQSTTFTVEIAGMAAVLGFLLSLFFLYRIYLKKRSEKVTSRDIAKMLMGAFFLGVAGNLESLGFVLAGIFFVLFCISFYFAFLKK